MVQIGANPVGDRIFHDEFVVMPHQFHGIIWIVHGPSEGATAGSRLPCRHSLAGQDVVPLVKMKEPKTTALVFPRCCG
jgi:hypothetical protein